MMKTTAPAKKGCYYNRSASISKQPDEGSETIRADSSYSAMGRATVSSRFSTKRTPGFFHQHRRILTTQCSPNRTRQSFCEDLQKLDEDLNPRRFFMPSLSILGASYRAFLHFGRIGAMNFNNKPAVLADLWLFHQEFGRSRLSRRCSPRLAEESLSSLRSENVVRTSSM